MASRRLPPQPSLRPVHLLIPVLAGTLPVLHAMFVYRYFMVPQQALLLIALGGLIAAAMTGSLRWLGSESFWVKAALFLFTLMVVWLGLASILGVDPARSLISDDFHGTSWIFWVVCLLLFGATVRFRGKVLDGASKAISIAAGVLIGLTVLWLVGGEAIEEALVPVSRGGVPLPGIGHPAILGAFYGVASLISVGRWIRSKRPRYRLLIVAAGSAGLMVLTQSMVSMVTFSILFLAGLWLSRFYERSRLVTVAGAVVAAGIMIQILAVPNLVPPGAKTLEGTREEQVEAPIKSEPDANTGALDVRRGLWGAAITTIGNEPWLGVGANNFSYAYKKYATVANIRLAERGLAADFNDAHNIVLEIAATGGIPAAIALVLMLASVVWASKTSISSGDARTWAGLGALVLLAESMFQPLNLVSVPLIVILAGLALPERKDADDSGRSVPKALSVAAVLPVLATVMLAGTLLYSDQRLRTAELEWDASIAAKAVDANPYCTVCLFELGKIRRWDYVKEGRGTAKWALEPSLMAIDRHPLDSAPYLELGGGLLFMKEPAQALDQFEKALALDPHSWLAGHGTAVALLRLERFSEAVPYFQESIRRRPSPQSFQALAYAAEKAGLTALSAEASRKAKELAESASGS